MMTDGASESARRRHDLLRLGLPLTRGNHFTRDFPRRVIERWPVAWLQVIKGALRIRAGNSVRTAAAAP
jgi:hypothetical protein